MLYVVAGWRFEKDPKTYQTSVNIFGVTSSRSICGYALNKTAIDHSEEFSPTTLIKSQKPCRLVYKKLIAVKKHARPEVSRNGQPNVEQDKTT